MIKNDLKTAWIDEIPDDWRMVRASLAVTHVERSPLPDDEVVTCFRDGEVTLRSNRRTDGFTVSFQEIGYQHIEEGDLVIHSMDGGWGAIGVSDSDGKASPVVHAYRSEENDVKFIAYVLRSMAYSGYLIAQTKGIRERSTQFDRKSFSNLYLPLPDLETQRRIADYLDKEISEMDTLIEEFDGLATNLTDRRSLLITKKLYDHLDGCERSVVGLWNYASTNPLTPEFRDLPEGEKIDFLPLENVWSHGKADYSEKIAWDGGKSSYTQFRRGDILVPKVTPTVFHGRTMVAETESPIGLATSEVHTLRAHLNADPRWIVYNMLSSKFLDEVRGQIYGVAGLQRISTQYLSAFKVPLTPLEKQVEIADELDREFERMDALIEESTRLIENLKARKTALITEVVTGRKEV